MANYFQTDDRDDYFANYGKGGFKIPSYYTGPLDIEQEFSYCPKCHAFCDSKELIPRGEKVDGKVQPARCLKCRNKENKHGYNYKIYEGDWLLFEGNKKMCKHFTDSFLGASNRKDWRNRLSEQEFTVLQEPIKHVDEIYI